MDPSERRVASNVLPVLFKLHDHLRDCPYPWAVTGSLGMALQGMPVDVRDIDLQTDREGAYYMDKVFQPYVQTPVSFSTSSNIQSHYGEFEVDGVTVEVMGALQKKLSHGRWESPVLVSEHRVMAVVQDREIPVLDLRYEYEAYRKLGRTQRADQIRRWLQGGKMPGNRG